MKNAASITKTTKVDICPAPRPGVRLGSMRLDGPSVRACWDISFMFSERAMLRYLARGEADAEAYLARGGAEAPASRV